MLSFFSVRFFIKLLVYPFLYIKDSILLFYYNYNENLKEDISFNDFILEEFEYLLNFFTFRKYSDVTCFFNKNKTPVYAISDYYFDVNSTLLLINKLKFNDDEYFRGFLVFYTFLKKVILALVVSFLFMLMSFTVFQLSFLKVVGGWVIVLLFAYWLLSGFNFFLKRYRYGKFTSALQRFWKRALMCFWIIEGFLFVLFFYYMLNSSQEPIFMYDQISLYNFQLLSWKNFLINSVFIVAAIHLLTYVIIFSKVLQLRQQLPVLLVLTIIFLYTLFSESYQFYYLVNFYDDCSWVFSEDEGVWELESDSPRTRTKNHFLTLTILAKFWHYIFIFVSWVFFLMKTFEYGRVRYSLAAMNVQNYIIFYLMSWVFMYNWFKWFSHRFVEMPYYWFFTSPRDITTYVVITDMYQLLLSFIDLLQLSSFKFDYAFFYFNRVSDFTFTRGSLFTINFLSSVF